MREIIERLERCGVPLVTAVCLYRHYWSNGKEDALRRYVDAVEVACVG